LPAGNIPGFKISAKSRSMKFLYTSDPSVKAPVRKQATKQTFNIIEYISHSE